MLEHIDACNALIEAALSRGEGVLVHCQAGQSKPRSFECLHFIITRPIGRSVTIVAAFLMYSRHLDRDSALELIREARPSIGSVAPSSLRSSGNSVVSEALTKDS